MRKPFLIGVLLLALPLLAWAEPGMLRKPSPHTVDQTVERFEAAVRSKGLRVFPRIDHAAAATDYGLQMPATVVIGFGNPKYGTPFMLEQPEAGIDFPPRVVVYEDADGRVWLAYNTSSYLYGHLFERHGLDYPAGDVEFFRTSLEALTDLAVGTAPIGQ
jgi:uncharacterized protein (DUF302 family)